MYLRCCTDLTEEESKPLKCRLHLFWTVVVQGSGNNTGLGALHRLGQKCSSRNGVFFGNIVAGMWVFNMGAENQMIFFLSRIFISP